MIKTFADTFYYLALLNPSDAAHHLAVEVTDRRSGTLVTTQWVLAEVGDALAHSKTRHRFLSLIQSLNSDPQTIIVPADNANFSAGIELYRGRPDKSWSLTDCISFAVMAQYQVTDALTGDHHFQQAGFKLLL